MSKGRAIVLLLASLISLGALGAIAHGATAAAATGGSRVLELKLNGVVDPFIESYVKRGIEQAEGDGDVAVLLTIDTPGGLDSSMRGIVKAILASRVPVVCYTAPSGARAASAGTFVMLACPVNAMAPGTNIGAAHPVGVSGVIEQEKVTNDAAAFIRSLAQRWGRNADWAEDAVRHAVSITADEAVRQHVVDLEAPTEESLLRDIDGRTVRLQDGASVTLRTAGASLHARGMGLGAAFLHGLIDPNLAFLFFYLGLGLVVIELLHPGITVPGILGTLLLVTSFISFGFLPVRLGGVILLVASALFFLIELKHPGIGLPTVGGVVCLVLGGLLLFDSAVPNARVSPWLIGAAATSLALFFGFVVKAVVRTRRLPSGAGIEDLVGELGVALDDLAPAGQVRARRETWSAQSTGSRIPAGSPVRVVQVKGLRLIVEPGGDVSEAGPEPDRQPAEAREGGAG
jgi:membrane-bound serine protease (ClpP class)